VKRWFSDRLPGRGATGERGDGVEVEAADAAAADADDTRGAGGDGSVPRRAWGDFLGGPNQSNPPPFPHAMYPQAHVWYVFISALDVMFTTIVLHDPYGVEVNPVAAYIIQRWDLLGAVVYKFLLISFVILVCEFIGRREPGTGWLLAYLAVTIACFPVISAVAQLISHLA